MSFFLFPLIHCVLLNPSLLLHVTLCSILMSYNKHNTNIHAPGGIRTHNSSKRAAVDPRLRQNRKLSHKIAAGRFSCILKLYPRSVIQKITLLPKKATSVQPELLLRVSCSVLRLPFPKPRFLKCLAVSSFRTKWSYDVPK